MFTIIMNVIRLRSDDALFIVTLSTIKKYPQSVFFKLINNQDDVNCDFVVKDDNTFYVDINSDNLKVVVSIMRGYNIRRSELNNSVMFDLQRLGFDTDMYKDSGNKIIHPKKLNLT